MPTRFYYWFLSILFAIVLSGQVILLFHFIHNPSPRAILFLGYIALAFVLTLPLRLIAEELRKEKQLP